MLPDTWWAKVLLGIVIPAVSAVASGGLVWKTLAWWLQRRKVQMEHARQNHDLARDLRDELRGEVERQNVRIAVLEDKLEQLQLHTDELLTRNAALRSDNADLLRLVGRLEQENEALLLRLQLYEGGSDESNDGTPPAA